MGGLKMNEQHTQEAGYESSVNLFFLPSAARLKSSWLYNILDAHANSYGRTASSPLPTQCTWTHFLLAISVAFLQRTPVSCI